MPTQAATLHRCASCKRWSGERTAGTLPDTVEIPHELSTGFCVDGPWNGSERRARSACGQWVIWPQLQGQTETSPERGNTQTYFVPDDSSQPLTGALE